MAKKKMDPIDIAAQQRANEQAEVERKYEGEKKVWQDFYKNLPSD